MAFYLNKYSKFDLFENVVNIQYIFINRSSSRIQKHYLKPDKIYNVGYMKNIDFLEYIPHLRVNSFIFLNGILKEIAFKFFLRKHVFHIFDNLINVATH